MYSKCQTLHYFNDATAMSASVLVHSSTFLPLLTGGVFSVQHFSVPSPRLDQPDHGCRIRPPFRPPLFHPWPRAPRHDFLPLSEEGIFTSGATNHPAGPPQTHPLLLADSMWVVITASGLFLLCPEAKVADKLSDLASDSLSLSTSTMPPPFPCMRQRPGAPGPQQPRVELHYW
jgi:hypothetical protein